MTPLAPRWSLPARVGFRFFAVYFLVYVIFTQMLGSLVILPSSAYPHLPEWFQYVLAPGATPPVVQSVEWTAREVFGVTEKLVIFSGSGDKIFDWVLTFCLLVIALIVAVFWSLIALDRPHHHSTLHKWFRLFLRFALGSTLVGYGAWKVIPLQMPFPTLTRLLEPYGDFSPMGVLWSSIGASPAYETFTGCAELTAGFLLFIPRTALLGAVVALGVSIQIFVLNMTYDVPVKLFSFHLVLMSLFLLAPDAGRLLNVLLLDRPAGRSTVPPLGRRPWAIRVGVILQVVVGFYLVGMNLYGAMESSKEFGKDAPKSPLYGIWDVKEMSVDGTLRPPLLTDPDRWRRLVFERPDFTAFQRIDNSFAYFGSKLDMEKKSLTLTKFDDPNWNAAMTIDRPAPDRMTLDGEMGGKKVRLQLELYPREKFLLVSRGFHWVQENPFNR